MAEPTEPETMDETPVAFVIFGVTGDLTRRKLIPALYESAVVGRLPKHLTLIGFARRDWNDETMRKEFTAGVEEFARTKPINKEALSALLDHSCYIQSTFEDPAGYQKLADLLKSMQIPSCLFYLATPPTEYPAIIQHLGEAGLSRTEQGWRRIVIEKPYGRDLASAQELERIVHQVFDESQIYRIDHYLGKETVQNILVFRFANGIFEPLWSRHFIDHVQITVAETVGIGSRAGYYDKAGVIRDIFQNHMLQLLTLTAMEAPVAFKADAVRDEKVKVLKALRPIRDVEVMVDTFRAQYVSGIMDGQRVPGYKEEPGVPAETTTETFLAARLQVDNWRWAGVPFYIRSGKRMAVQLTEIAIQFKQVPLSLFGWKNMAGTAPNRLVLNLQPDEGITLTFGAKVPGPTDAIGPVRMDFNYTEAFGGEPPEAYERLLQDVMMGDATLFTRSDEVQAAWEFTTNLLDAWKNNPVRQLEVYEAGTWGPPGADEFIRRDGSRVWCT